MGKAGRIAAHDAIDEINSFRWLVPTDRLKILGHQIILAAATNDIAATNFIYLLNWNPTIGPH
jgi:hypothetical protein